jgi:uncharacterized protein
MSHRWIDPRSGLVFDIHELGRRAGAMKEIVRQTPAPEGLGNAMIGVPAASPLRLRLRLEAVVEGVLVTGVVDVSLHGECARCLRAVEAEAEIDVQELFLFPEREVDDEEASRVEGDFIDLEPVLRDAVVLDLPFIPLCREDCAGLCPLCGSNLNDDPDHSHVGETDPRWADLDAWTPGNDED